MRKMNKHINEGFLEKLIGDEAAASIKGAASGIGQKEYLLLARFLKDFVGDASASLRVAMQAGLLEPPPKNNPEKKPDVKKDISTEPENTQTPVTAESKYKRLNRIFETIVEQAEIADRIPIATYIEGWFTKYMGAELRAEWKSRERFVNPIFQEIQNTYRIDGGKKALERLGKVAYAIAKSKDITPAGAENIEDTSKQPSAEPTSAELGTNLGLVRKWLKSATNAQLKQIEVQIGRIKAEREREGTTARPKTSKKPSVTSPENESVSYTSRKKKLN